MNVHKLVTLTSIAKMAGCFTSNEEFRDFVDALNIMAESIFMESYIVKTRSNKQQVINAAKQLGAVTLFYREHFEVIHRMMQHLDSRDATPEEAKQYDEHGDDLLRGDDGVENDI